MYNELGGLSVLKKVFSLKHCRIVGRSWTRSLSMAAELARLSARSFPVMLACPGLKIHVIFSSALFTRLKPVCIHAFFFEFLQGANGLDCDDRFGVLLCCRCFSASVTA